jgi:tetratricopeptide (TPR) repeat protein
VSAIDEALLERIEGLEELLEEEPDALTHFMLATELLKADRALEATAHYRAVLVLDPQNTAAYRGLGRELLTQGDNSGAITVFQAGLAVAEQTGDLQTAKEMEVFLRKAQS